MKELEKKFHIIIDDTQIATIIRILKYIRKDRNTYVVSLPVPFSI